MKYKLSICIPTLNRGSYIGETLESIAAQLVEGVEVVIVDGGSTDNTEQVVNSFQQKYPDIRYIKKESSGKTPSNEGFDRDCNHSVELAAGKYCWLMTDDDLLMPGAIQKILSESEKECAVIVTSVEVRNSDFTELLVQNRPNIAADRTFSPAEWNEFAMTVGSHLTFVGAVIIKRDLWLNRSREKYFGSGFIHVGVIFDEPINEKMLVISNPLVSIRFGNAQWTSRAFQIWMINWPSLIWSFSGITDAAKQAICAREPWRRMTTLLFNRALGMYSYQDYELFIKDQLNSKIRKLFSKSIAMLPRSLLYVPILLYIHATVADSAFVLYNLKESWKKK